MDDRAPRQVGRRQAGDPAGAVSACTASKVLRAAASREDARRSSTTASAPVIAAACTARIVADVAKHGLHLTRARHRSARTAASLGSPHRHPDAPALAWPSDARCSGRQTPIRRRWSRALDIGAPPLAGSAVLAALSQSRSEQRHGLSRLAAHPRQPPKSGVDSANAGATIVSGRHGTGPGGGTGRRARFQVPSVRKDVEVRVLSWAPAGLSLGPLCNGVTTSRSRQGPTKAMQTDPDEPERVTPEGRACLTFKRMA
jgi:hypothetical protein